MLRERLRRIAIRLLMPCILQLHEYNAFFTCDYAMPFCRARLSCHSPVSPPAKDKRATFFATAKAWGWVIPVIPNFPETGHSGAYGSIRQPKSESAPNPYKHWLQRAICNKPLRIAENVQIESLPLRQQS